MNTETGRNLGALSIVVALAPLSVACSGTSDLKPEELAATEQAVVTPGFGFQAAFQGSGSTLWESGNPTKDTGSAMMGTTSPSIAALNGGGFEIAFQGSNQDLWFTGKTGAINTKLPMNKSTSPSIIGLDYPGGYEATFQDNDANHWLWVAGTAGSYNTWYGMKGGTNPSIAALPGGGWAVAFQANTGNLWVVGSAGEFREIAPMAPNTSPSIASMPDGTWQVAFQGSNYDLWTYDGVNPPVDMQLGMAPNATSPSIAPVPGGGYEMAFRANTGYLWVTGTLGQSPTPYGIAANTSPSIAVFNDGTYEVAFTANQTNHLWFYGSNVKQDTNGAMKPGSSPSISPVYNAPTGLAYSMNVYANPPYLDLSWVATGASYYWVSQSGQPTDSKYQTYSPAYFTNLTYGNSYQYTVMAEYWNGFQATSDPLNVTFKCTTGCKM